MQTILRTKFAFLALVFAGTVSAAPANYMAMSAADVASAFPELAGMKAAPTPEAFQKLLTAAGRRIDAMAEDSVDVSAAEAVVELGFRSDEMSWTSRKAQLRYAVEWPLKESRSGKQPEGFAAPGGFMTLMAQFSGARQKKLRVRPLGEVSGTPGATAVGAFAQDRSEGLIWLDSATGTVRRIHEDLVLEDGTQLAMDVEFNPVRFAAVDVVEWLPRNAVVQMEIPGGVYRSVHRFSDYHLFGIDDADDAAQKKANSGLASEGADREQDAPELMAEAASTEDKARQMELLQQALKLDQRRAEVHAQLSVVAAKSGTYDVAEREARTAIELAPRSAAPQNLLGVVLFRKGAAAAAIPAFRASVALNDAVALTHFYLAEALEKSGDPKAAVEEYRKAVALAPQSKEFAARLEARTRPAVPVAAEDAGEPIRVDVRQVLVPVVVTRGGHSVTALGREDFHVFEDGVEQKIVSFAVEHSGAPETSAADAPAASPGVPAAGQPRATPPAARRTYVICVDALHTAFSNLVYVRDALLKLLKAEQSGDTQYVVMTLGAQANVLEKGTRDASAAVRAVQGDALSKAWTGSRRGAPESLDEFQRELQRVRDYCDHRNDPLARSECESGLRQVPQTAGRMADFERLATSEFVRQLGEVVRQLAARNERHTILLVSDGFSMTPGEAAWRLVAAYLPEIREANLRTTERLTGELEPALRIAQQKNVPIYTVDSRGLYVPPGFSASSAGTANASVFPHLNAALNQLATSAGQTLSQIAGDTGGVAYQNSNDLFTGMARAFADGRDYYTLAYVSSNAGTEKKFRNITVRVSDSKAQVVAKKGYWPETN